MITILENKITYVVGTFNQKYITPNSDLTFFMFTIRATLPFSHLLMKSTGLGPLLSIRLPGLTLVEIFLHYFIIAQPCLGSTRERSFVFVITDPRKKLAVKSFLLFHVFSAKNRFSTNTVRCDSFLVSRTYVRVQLLARLTQYRSGLLKPPRVLVCVTLSFYNINFVD